MIIFSQDDPFMVKVWKSTFATVVAFVSAAISFFLMGAFMYLLVEGPNLIFGSLFFLLEKLSELAQLLYSWVV